MRMTQTRRQFLTTASVVSASSLVGPLHGRGAEGGLETTTVRLVKNQGICYAPQYVAEDLLRGEGFTDIRYVEVPPPEISAAIARGNVDFGMNYGLQLVRDIDAGAAITVISGVMVGCVELFARESIRSVIDLKGKSVGVQATGSLPNIFVVLMAAMSVSIPITTYIGSLTRRSSQGSFLSTAKSTHSSVFRRSRRSCAPAALATSSSIPRSIARGRNIIAACWLLPRNMSAITRSQPSACCVQSSRPPTCVPPSRPVRRECSSTAGLRPATTMPCRP